MKTTITLSGILLISAMFAIAQKPDKQDITFSFTKMPLEPLNKSIKNYNSKVVLAYEANIIAQKKEAQDEYDKAMAEYPKKVKEAENKYKEEMKAYEAAMAEWKEKSTGSKIVEKKILNEDNKPREPYLNTPSEPYLREVQHQKIFNKEMLASTYLKIEGFTNSPDNAIKITATLYGFENMEPELKTKEESYYDTQSKSTQKKVTSWYEIQYKHPIGLKIELPNGEILMDEILQQFGQYTTANAGSNYSYNNQAFISNLQNKVVEDNMKAIYERINSKYGFVKTQQTSAIYTIKAKKFTYDDYQQAYESAVAGYGLLTSNFSSATEKINKAIALWEKALTEFDPTAKKERIDDDVAIATHFNLAEAYIWINNFEKADEHLSKIIGLKPSKKEEKAVEAFRELLKDQKARWEANNR